MEGRKEGGGKERGWREGKRGREMLGSLFTVYSLLSVCPICN